jgi:transcriptional regulator with XRE-family HTH domain
MKRCTVATPHGPRKPGRQDVVGRFGAHVIARRKERNWTIRELAKRANMAHSNIFQFENLGKNPRLTELVALAGAFEEPLVTFIAALG